MIGIVVLLALKKRGLLRGLIIAAIAEACLITLSPELNGVGTTKAAHEMDQAWVAFDQKAIDTDIAAGKTVFLDVTADWCLTCKANMKFTLSRDEVKQRLFSGDVVAMQADWTNPDPIVTDLLHRYGRFGIPFNIVYGPGAPQGIVLPELLTPTLVLQALDKASHP
jgi:suppressor for copper-sensitivity B